ncbi:hypothetical protein BD410DRAFT_897563 [Rickenella mellea]|uniref:Fungal-type protein kinase domain-containing protein n=1 Tax=Rickenella mellea TaxID=50990 RepID=A0A4Y7Q867_9AGAM|nr:hypothetical protein BD410DRAFT_897563 [Rickenella mellea]
MNYHQPAPTPSQFQYPSNPSESVQTVCAHFDVPSCRAFKSDVCDCEPFGLGDFLRIASVYKSIVRHYVDPVASLNGNEAISKDEHDGSYVFPADLELTAFPPFTIEYQAKPSPRATGNERSNCRVFIECNSKGNGTVRTRMSGAGQFMAKETSEAVVKICTPIHHRIHHDLESAIWMIILAIYKRTLQGHYNVDLHQEFKEFFGAATWRTILSVRVDAAADQPYLRRCVAGLAGGRGLRYVIDQLTKLLTTQNPPYPTSFDEGDRKEFCRVGDVIPFTPPPPRLISHVDMRTIRERPSKLDIEEKRNSEAGLLADMELPSFPHVSKKYRATPSHSGQPHKVSTLQLFGEPNSQHKGTAGFQITGTAHFMAMEMLKITLKHIPPVSYAVHHDFESLIWVTFFSIYKRTLHDHHDNDLHREFDNFFTAATLPKILSAKRAAIYDQPRLRRCLSRVSFAYVIHQFTHSLYAQNPARPTPFSKDTQKAIARIRQVVPDLPPPQPISYDDMCMVFEDGSDLAKTHDTDLCDA